LTSRQTNTLTFKGHGSHFRTWRFSLSEYEKSRLGLI
jgi:hypothetical protein